MVSREVKLRFQHKVSSGSICIMQENVANGNLIGPWKMDLGIFEDFAKNKNLSSQLDLVRVCILFFFDKLNLNLDASSNVAVVGGSLYEPELHLLKSSVDLKSIEVFGISPGEIFLDVNTDLVPGKFRGKYDLVLCSGVVEHIYNHENLIKCLKDLSANTGRIFFSFPISNMYHGSPDYFSSGFTTDFFIKFFERLGLEIEDSGSVGGERIYFFTHTLNQWPNLDLYRRPLLFHVVHCLGLTALPRPPIKSLFSRLWARAFAWLIPKYISNEEKWQHTGWVLARKTE